MADQFVFLFELRITVAVMKLLSYVQINKLKGGQYLRWGLKTLQLLTEQHIIYKIHVYCLLILNMNFSLIARLY